MELLLENILNLSYRVMEFLKSKKFWKIFIIAFIVGVIIGGVLEYIKLSS